MLDLVCLTALSGSSWQIPFWQIVGRLFDKFVRPPGPCNLDIIRRQEVAHPVESYSRDSRCARARLFALLPVKRGRDKITSRIFEIIFQCWPRFLFSTFSPSDSNPIQIPSNSDMRLNSPRWGALNFLQSDNCVKTLPKYYPQVVLQGGAPKRPTFKVRL